MIDRRSLRTGAAMAVVLALGSVSISGQPVALRYHWTKGEALKYKTTQQTALTMTGLPGMGDMAVTSTATITLTMTPDSVAADGTATLKERFDAIRLDVVTPMGTVAVDSAATPAAPIDPATAASQKVLQALVGETVTVVMAPAGTINSVDGMSKINAKLKASMADASSDPTAAAIQQALDSMMTDESFKGSAGQSFAVLPDKPVATGETWKTQLTQTGAIGATTSSNVFTMKGVDRVDGRDISRIGVASTISVAPGGTLGPMAVNAKDGTGDGEILFDHQHGRIVSSVIHLTMPLSLSMAAPDGTAVNLQGVSKSTITTALVER
jgi:hypothetical protein